MKTLKLILGTISFILVLIIAFQSCAIGLEDTFNGTNGGIEFVLALFMLIGGIIGVINRNSRSFSITAGCFYIIGGIIGCLNSPLHSDLRIWSIISLICAFLFISIATKQKI
ncbi:hypothetical protein [Clostridium weizhouense]|uniref:Lipoprotein n=1 Tax=Clostridium weizhouense TaxID=2859781 RepID=A0ABS7AM44_9CLOT|nr:hypothetical protein [Clostridium weizhouense]MBW6409481.1 hypothetical protein [Clostridium weizhouense]